MQAQGGPPASPPVKLQGLMNLSHIGNGLHYVLVRAHINQVNRGVDAGVEQITASRRGSPFPRLQWLPILHARTADLGTCTCP
jgi:hypothetical protein